VADLQGSRSRDSNPGPPAYKAEKTVRREEHPGVVTRELQVVTPVLPGGSPIHAERKIPAWTHGGPRPEDARELVEGICETQIPPQNTAPLASSSTLSTQIARTDLAAVVPDARSLPADPGAVVSEPRHLGNNYCATCQRDVDTRRIIGVQYRWDQPEAYDGISEWAHEKCGRREGRWSHRELSPGEHEARYGGVDRRTCQRARSGLLRAERRNAALTRLDALNAS
jgi:hypothetical protein